MQSKAPAGKLRVSSVYYDPDTDELVFEVEDQ